MAYSGTVDLISGIRPKNNGTFPLVNAHDVYVDDNTRLDTALSNIDSRFTPFAERTFDFSTIDGAWEAVAAIITQLGGTVSGLNTATSQNNN